MLQEHSGSGAFIIALALALAPALLRWWWGRALAGLAEHPLIAERLQAHHARLGPILVAWVLLLCIAWPAWAVWTVPVVFFSQCAASYPLTRTLYAETWSLGAFVSFYTRLTIAVFGFWVMLASAPWIVAAAGEWDWAAASALALVLVAADRRGGDVVRALLRTVPITDPVLLQRFAALVQTSGIPAPRFECVPMRGGVLANALALPSLRRSSVVFTETLLSRLSVDETVAICAHELAHLEYYDARRLRQIRIANWFLIALLCGIMPLARVVYPGGQIHLAMVCSGAAGMALVLRGRFRQQNETASDRRAVELTGGTDTLARALTSLHAIARVPRRWDQRREQQATHPSLSRRIRDIQAAAGVATPAALAAPATFQAARGDASASFDDTRLHWHEAPGTSHVLEYGTLSELRVQVSPSGDASLVVVERRGRRWSMPARSEDAAALQAVLDTVDGRLGTHVPARSVSAPATRLVAVFGCVLAACAAQFALALVAAAAILAPVPALLNASGAAAFVTAAVVLRDDGPGNVLVPFLLLVGAGFLIVARVRRADVPRPAGTAIAILVVGAVMATASIALGGVDAVRLHQGARATPAAAVMLVALAAACWSWRSRPHVRYAALAAALTGLSTVAIGSTAFLDYAGRDLFLVKADPLRWTGLDRTPAETFDLPFGIDALRLSPHGRLAAVVRTRPDEDEGAAPTVFHLRHSGGAVTALAAADLAFIDERHVLLLRPGPDSAELSVESFDGAPAVRWRERVPDIGAASLAYDRSTGQWAVTGRGSDGRIVRAAGVVGQPGFDRTTWQAPQDRGGWIEALGTRGNAAIAMQKQYGYGIFGAALISYVPVGLLQSYPESLLWRLAPESRSEAGRSRLDVACLRNALDAGILCTAFDGTRTRVVAVEPVHAAVVALGIIDGPFYADRAATRGWLTGWWRGRPAAIELQTRRGFRLPRQGHEFVELIAPAETVIGTATTVEGGTRIRLYPLSALAATLTRAE